MMRIYLTGTDPTAGQVLSTAVSRAGHEPVVVPDLEALLAAMPCHLPCLVLLLPGIDSPGICRDIRSLADGGQHYIVLFERESPGETVKGLDAGASAVMCRRSVSDEVRAVIEAGVRSVLRERDREEHCRRLQRVARTDTFTGLLNHAAVLEELAIELSRAHREGSRTGVLMVDIDDFKAVNDTYGHQAGDGVITGFASMLRESCRPYDRIGRYGGDEFIVILPRIEPGSCISIAERMRSNTARLDFDHLVPGLRITCSIGACTSDRGPESPAELVSAADRALYEAKSAGKDRVRPAPSTGHAED